MSRPRLLDLFCGAGGAAMGYHRAGFDVVGVDIKPQKNYPFEFHQFNALSYSLDGFDFVHASPPCQAYVSLSNKDGRHPELIEPTRERLRQWGGHYAIENVVGAPLLNPVRLCGSTFGLHVRRHRLFETNFEVSPPPPCQHKAQGEIRAYYGKKGWAAWVPKGDNVQKAGRRPLLRGSVQEAPADMGIDWMDWDELRESIPPAYTEFIGKAFLEMKAAA